MKSRILNSYKSESGPKAIFMFDTVINFIKETRVEMSRVTWPTRDIIVRDTILVVIVSLGLAVFLGALDKVFTFLVTTFLL